MDERMNEWSYDKKNNHDNSDHFYEEVKVLKEIGIQLELVLTS